jgi:hypothetical protein
LARDTSAAQIKAAISVAIVLGDQPFWFSHRSCCRPPTAEQKRGALKRAAPAR